MPEFVLPELARSLRSLGAQRDVSAHAAHSAVFVPLLEARARAGQGSLDRMFAALKGESLATRIETLAVASATAGVEDPATIRALTARTSELLVPLRGCLAELDKRAKAVRADESAWDRWVAQLRTVFVCADVACADLASLIAGRASGPTGSWFVRGTK